METNQDVIFVADNTPGLEPMTTKELLSNTGLPCAQGSKDTTRVTTSPGASSDSSGASASGRQRGQGPDISPLAPTQKSPRKSPCKNVAALKDMFSSTPRHAHTVTREEIERLRAGTTDNERIAEMGCQGLPLPNEGASLPGWDKFFHDVPGREIPGWVLPLLMLPTLPHNRFKPTWISVTGQRSKNHTLNAKVDIEQTLIQLLDNQEYQMARDYTLHCMVHMLPQQLYRFLQMNSFITPAANPEEMAAANSALEMLPLENPDDWQELCNLLDFNEEAARQIQFKLYAIYRSKPNHGNVADYIKCFFKVIILQHVSYSGKNKAGKKKPIKLVGSVVWHHMIEAVAR